MQYIIAMFYCAQNFMSVLVIYYEFHSDGSEVYSNIRYTMIMFNPNLRIGIQLHRNQTLKLSTHYLHLQVNVCLLKALWLQITFKFELRDQIISIFISGPPLFFNCIRSVVLVNIYKNTSNLNFYKRRDYINPVIKYSPYSNSYDNIILTLVSNLNYTRIFNV